MTWTIDSIERELLSAKIGTVAFPPSEVVDAANRAQKMLGNEWIAARTCNQKGLAQAMQIIGMGLRLRSVERLTRNRELLDKLRKQEASADAELTSIYLFSCHSPEIEIELFPPVGTRVADFRVRKGPE